VRAELRLYIAVVKATDADNGKTILGIANNQLFMGDLLTAGADGYPRRFLASHWPIDRR
jgi:hypothetical protein